MTVSINAQHTPHHGFFARCCAGRTSGRTMCHKRVILLALLVGLSLVIGSFFRPPVLAQQTKEHDGKSKQEVKAEPLGKESVEDKSLMQCPMMAGLKGIDLFADSPEVLRSRVEDLGLSDKQVEQLKKSRSRPASRPVSY